MIKDFNKFMSQLQTSIVHFDYFCDFDKVRRNVSAIEIKLNTLNYLIGKSDLLGAIKELWKVNPEVFDITEILIAVRSKDKKSVADENSNPVLLSKYLESPESIFELMTKTGLAEVICNKEVKNLVDYVFGVEVGMDTNARKNRGGKIMENAVAKLLDQGGVKYTKQFPSKKIPEVQNALGKDKKVFDFVVKTKKKTYLIEVNFFSDEGGGSKLNEVARSFDGTAARINSLSDYEFVWITDGTSWFAAEDKLEEAYNNIPKLYNLTSIQEFIKLVNDDK